MNFEEMSKIDVSKQIEKKGKFSYLSWPYAVSEFRKACPNGTWRIGTFGENKQPYCQTDSGSFVVVEVCPDIGAQSISFTQVHPVLNNYNKPIADPTCFDINTSIQRCLVKAIAIATGIGLFVYAGEDLPPESPKEKEVEEMIKTDEIYQKYIDHIDKLNSADAVINYVTSIWPEVKKKLPKQDKEKLKSYANQIVDVFNSKK